MALEYDLELAASIDEKQALEMLASRIGGFAWGDDHCMHTSAGV
ncbi:hypothetical protein [Vitiosangium sp. GDMCC 1.1324]|nr:hypothetical protein [Vitiosangium sp. GDMCC 1.1324]